MRIAVVLPSYWPAIGGCEIHTRELVARLARRHEVEVFTGISRDEDKELGKWFMWSPLLAARSMPERYSDGKVQVTRIGMPRWWKSILYLLLRLGGTERLPLPLRRPLARLFVIGYQRQLREVIGKPDLIHAIHQDCAWFGYAAMRLAREMGIPCTYTPVSHIYSADRAISGDYSSQQPLTDADAHPLLRGVFGEMFLHACTDADAVFAMTEGEGRYFASRGARGEVLAVGVGPVLASTPAPDVRALYGVPPGSPLILFLGRINSAKGVTLVLEASRIVWREEPDARFLFVGPFERGSEALFAHRKDPRLSATGAVDLERKTGALLACDILCLPSVNESLGGVYLEAWAFGKPVVGARIPPFLELSGNGAGGIAVEPTVEGVARAILLLLRDRDLARRMGAWGRARVEQQFNWEAIASRVGACFERITERGLRRDASRPDKGTVDA